VLTKLMRELPQAKSIAVMIQKEVGDKLLSGPGDDGYGPLAVMCQYRYHVMRALDVPAACFNPPPKVDSSFMVLEKLEQPRVNVGDEEIFTRLVRSAFAMRRKTLLNNLVSGFSLNREQAVACLAAANLSAQARAEELSLEDFAGLAIQLQNTIR
jgi:16S rRNA (adenine1518-N6/adenine1519-N6)-dimethyltransferase